jgi:chromosome segregation ATPase
MSAGVTAWNGRATRDLYLAAVDAVAVILEGDDGSSHVCTQQIDWWRQKHAEAKHDYELLRRENEQLREALGMARKEYGGKDIADLDEYDRLRLTANAFQAMNGVLELQVKRQRARIAELEDRELQLQEQAGEMAEELERLRPTPVCRFCGEPESDTVWCCDARMEASEQGEG